MLSVIEGNRRESLLERLYEDAPRFHKKQDGTPGSWAVPPEVLRKITSMLSPGMTTLETGAGYTTVAFAIAGTKHTCITPAVDEVEKIKEYLAKSGIKNEVTFICRNSDAAFTGEVAIPDELDFVFIDGGHKFPFPALDWYYTQKRLRIGGIVGVDDIQIPTVRQLYDFLCIEDEWELADSIIHNTAFFRKISKQIRCGDWKSQKINLIGYPQQPD